MRTIKEMWENYSEKCIPADMSIDKVIEVKTAFYAGVGSGVVLLAELGLGSDRDLAAMIARIDAWRKETQDFVELVASPLGQVQ